MKPAAAVTIIVVGVLGVAAAYFAAPAPEDQPRGFLSTYLGWTVFWYAVLSAGVALLGVALLVRALADGRRAE